MGIHFKSATSSVRRSPFQAISAVFVMSLTFFIATLFTVLIYSSDRLLNYFETRPQVIAFIKTDTDESAIAALQHKLEGDSRVKEVRYVNKDEALSIYKKATSNNPQLGELVSSSIFPASLEFTVKDLSYTKDIIEEVKKEKIVDTVGFTASIGDDTDLNNVVLRLKRIAYYLRIGGIGLTGILAFVSFVVLLVIISMRLVTRKDEIEILNLLGATPKFIRSPVVIEAVIYTVSGVIIGWMSIFIITLYLLPGINNFFGEISIFPREFLEITKIFSIIFFCELLAGILIAYLGSFLAVSRVKRLR